MKRIEEKKWVIIGYNGTFLNHTISDNRNISIKRVETARLSNWKYLKSRGYKCVRATLSCEIPDEL